MNFTDVDDKTIAGAQKAGMPLREYTDQWIDAFREDADAARARAARGDAARDRRGEPARDGRHDPARSSATATPTAATGRSTSRSRRCPTYGQLARLDHEGMQAGARVDVDEYAKDDARDFVLWKATKPGEPTWDVGAGPGPPGLAHRVLGDGAAAARRAADRHPRRRRRSDLPASRERDRADRRRDQQPFSRFWVHVEHLFVENEKMSKSLGNVYTRARHRRARAIAPSALRYLLLSSHYRKQLNFTWAGMEQAEEALRRLADFLARLETASTGQVRIADGRRRVRARRATRSATRCETISTRRPRWRRCSIWCAT